MRKSKLIAVVATLAVLLLMPQALAVSSSFGGVSINGATGKSESMSLQSDDSFASQETLSFGSGVSMESTGKVSLESEEGWADQYHDAASGSLYAATYAYMDNPGSYTYDYSKSASKSAVKISEKVTATDAANLLYGGFAYNDKNYAAVQTWGSAGSINYQNSLSATTSKASASQSLSADNAYLGIESWAERGNKEGESLDQKAIDDTWIGKRQPGSHPADVTYDLAVSQYANIMGGTIKSYSGSASIDASSATAEQKANIPVASYLELFGTSARGRPLMTEESATDDASAADNAGANWVFAYTRLHINNGKNIAFSAKTKSTNKDITASQTVEAKNVQYTSGDAHADSFIGEDSYQAHSNSYVFGHPAEDTEETLAYVKSSDSATARNGYASVTTTLNDAKNADHISKSAWAESWTGEKGYYAESESMANRNVAVENTLTAATPTEIMASMKGSESATAKKDYASVAQSTDAKGGQIHRSIEAFEGGQTSSEGVRAFTGLFLGFLRNNEDGSSEVVWRVPEAASSLSGKASATVTGKGATLSGAWKSSLAKDLTAYLPEDYQSSFNRYSSADNGEDDHMYVSAVKSSVNNAKSISFKESASETPADATAT